MSEHIDCNFFLRLFTLYPTICVTIGVKCWNNSRSAWLYNYSYDCLLVWLSFKKQSISFFARTADSAVINNLFRYINLYCAVTWLFTVLFNDYPCLILFRLYFHTILYFLTIYFLLYFLIALGFLIILSLYFCNLSVWQSGHTF